MKSTSLQHDESGSKRFWLFDPQCNGMEFFLTEKERDAAAKLAIQGYLEEGLWVEEPTGIVAGLVTHVTQQTNRTEKPAELDEDGMAHDGSFWDSDCEYKCDYTLLPI